MTYLIAGLAIFLAIHSVRIVAPDWREKTMNKFGELPWKAVYAIVSLASFLLMTRGYSMAQPVASEVYPQFKGMYIVVIVLMALAAILVVAYALGPSYIKQKLKHPFLLAIILWSISHLWMNGDAASVTLFGGLLVWAVIDLWSALRRPNGPVRVPLVRNDIIAVVGGLALYALFVWRLHIALFGVAPVV